MQISRRQMMAATGGMLAASALPLGSVQATGRHDFELNFAPSPGQFEHLAGKDIIDQMNFAADMGFTAWEDNGLKKRDVALQEKIGETLARRNMTMGVFVAHKIKWREPSIATGKPEAVETFLQDIRGSIPVAKRSGARWMTVVPGHRDRKLHENYQMANLADALKRACEILEPHGIVMVLEPLNTYRNHPGMILREIPQAYYLCKAVGSPSCKILFDMYHQQIQEGNIIPNIDAAWEEIAYFQIGDNPGRKEPTTGEMNYRNIFKHIKSKGFDGVMGMEHGRKGEGAAGEQAVIDAYVKTGTSF